jgi:hypothetical protein
MKRAVLGRSHAEVSSESSGQVTLIRETCGTRDFGERRFTIDDRINGKF